MYTPNTFPKALYPWHFWEGQAPSTVEIWKSTPYFVKVPSQLVSGFFSTAMPPSCKLKTFSEKGLEDYLLDIFGPYLKKKTYGPEKFQFIDM